MNPVAYEFFENVYIMSLRAIRWNLSIRNIDLERESSDKALIHLLSNLRSAIRFLREINIGRTLRISLHGFLHREDC